MRFVEFGNLKPVLPIIQGGMGVGVSRSKLAGAVAREGGIGIISTAQIGFDEPDFETDTAACNLRAIEKHIQLAKKISRGNGLVGVNVMHALQHYKEHVRAAAKAGADVIICGAGLPTDLPELVEGTKACIAPIVSTKKAADLIVRMWKKRYDRLPDFVVIEGPKAGGHLGFSPEQLTDIPGLDYESEIKAIIQYIRQVGRTYRTYIPVFVAGGISNNSQVQNALSLGADGVQVATRFVTTEECDAAESYKMAYVNAKASDVTIIKSPVGMPGRALRNRFVERTLLGQEKISKCFRCIKNCNPAEIPYCITKALINAVQGDIDNGLIFCGDNVGDIKEISTVHDVINELLNIQDMEFELPLDNVANL